MVGTVRLYFDATMALAIMAILGIIAGFIAFASTDDRGVALVVTAAVFVLTGAILTVRLWRVTRKSMLPSDSET